MIGRLRGLLTEKQPPWLVLEVNGVGYELEAPMSTFYKLPELQQEVRLYTHLSVREDAHLLYGFATADERRLFRALLKVNGVGPKLALAILSGIELKEFSRCVNDSDSARLVRLPGVGKKTAERLIVEMRDRISDWATPTLVADGPLMAGQESNTVALEVVNNPETDAISALVALGYKPQEASRLVHSIKEPNLSSEQLIRKALQAAM